MDIITVNILRYRLSLNYKGIPYKTEWVEYPDIEALCIKIGAPATSKHANGHPKYTLPMIFDPTTQRIVNKSAAIAKYLDDTYPATPTLFPKGTDALQAAFLGAAWETVHHPLYMITISRTNAVLTPRSQAYYRPTSEAEYGGNLEALYKPEEWPELEKGLQALDKWLKANGPGRDERALGEGVCFSDLQLVATFYWTRLVCGEDSEDWKRFASLNGGKWKRILESFAKYTIVQ